MTKIQGDIWAHEAEAFRLWFKHIEHCAEELGIDFDTNEKAQATEAFEECQQLKILQDGSIKVKWEHPCWWADCKHPVFYGDYYCVLAHPKDVTWKSPYDLAREANGMRCVICDDEIMNPPVEGTHVDDYCSCECFEVAFDAMTKGGIIDENQV